MHISIIGKRYEYVNGMKIELPELGVSHTYDLKIKLRKFSPKTK